MGTHKVDLSLGDGSHANLIECTSEEASKRADKDDVSIPAGQSDAHANQVLLGNEALDVALWEGLLVGEGEGGILGVPIGGDDSRVVLSQLHESISVRLTGSNLERKVGGK